MNANVCEKYWTIDNTVIEDCQESRVFISQTYSITKFPFRHSPYFTPSRILTLCFVSETLRFLVFICFVPLSTTHPLTLLNNILNAQLLCLSLRFNVLIFDILFWLWIFLIPRLVSAQYNFTRILVITADWMPIRKTGITCCLFFLVANSTKSQWKKKKKKWLSGNSMQDKSTEISAQRYSNIWKEYWICKKEDNTFKAKKYFQNIIHFWNSNFLPRR